ncbi:MAG: glycosyltransferase family 2 protein [Cypionkella sp.]|uniref:glycosyltransferase family 2 protein n=1 Tax=Cypionkella sp. TaxID=2811411 RepID=UPI002ABC364E|nr:glycosyltransferase family 2 protein [Cypionkella sp.]MDZ4309655.1 glycosyltransferase family 2 protein [Cypionkella sp.]
MPRLTIGLITYNGADTIERSIDSLLGQSFGDLELLIFDNASTDETSAICAEYAARDPRVRHVRHPETLPQSANFRGVLMAAGTELFMWASDDDIWGPRFAEICIAELDRDPQVVSACTQVQFRREDDTEYPARGTFTIRGTVEERIRIYLSNPRDSARLYGVYRTASLKRAYPSDVNFFAYDWLVVGLSMLEGAHVEANGMELVRSANPPGKYFEKYSRHFVREKGLVGRLSYFLPLLPLTREFKRRLPTAVWKAARGKLMRLNLHQMFLLLKWKYPVFEGLFRTIRRMDRAIGNSWG